jgi:hypothetical protein
MFWPTRHHVAEQLHRSLIWKYRSTPIVILVATSPLQTLLSLILCQHWFLVRQNATIAYLFKMSLHCPTWQLEAISAINFFCYLYVRLLIIAPNHVSNGYEQVRCDKMSLLFTSPSLKVTRCG